MKQERKHLVITKNRPFLLTVSVLSLILALVTTIFFTRYVLDCYRVDEQITVRTTNNVSYTLDLKDGNSVTTEDVIEMGNPVNTYYSDDIVNTTAKGIATLRLSKAASVSYEYETTVKMLFRPVSGSANDVAKVLEYQIDRNQDGVIDQHDRNLKQETINLKANETKIINLEESIDIHYFIDELAAFSATRPGIAHTARLYIDFKFYVHNSKNLIQQTLTRGLYNDVVNRVGYYQIGLDGASLTTKDYPELRVGLPGLWQTIVVVIYVAGLVIIASFALKEYTANPDLYLRKLHRFLRKFKDEIVVAKKEVDVSGIKQAIEVADFEELVKFAHNLSKPLVYVEQDDCALFYIFCDTLMYRYELRR